MYTYSPSLLSLPPFPWLYNLNGWIMWCMDYISINMLKKKPSRWRSKKLIIDSLLCSHLQVKVLLSLTLPSFLKVTMNLCVATVVLLFVSSTTCIWSPHDIFSFWKTWVSPRQGLVPFLSSCPCCYWEFRHQDFHFCFFFLCRFESLSFNPSCSETYADFVQFDRYLSTWPLGD